MRKPHSLEKRSTNMAEVEALAIRRQDIDRANRTSFTECGLGQDRDHRQSKLLVERRR